MWYLTILKLSGTTGNQLDTIEYTLTQGTTGDFIRQISVDNYSNVYLMGQIIQPSSSRKYIFIKYDSAFSVKWVKIDSAYSIMDQYEFKFLVNNDGTVIRRYVSGVMKYDANGNLLWTFPKDSIYDFIVAKDGNLYLTGGDKTEL